MAVSALPFYFFIIIPLQDNDESTATLIQTSNLIRLSLTANNNQNPLDAYATSNASDTPGACLSTFGWTFCIQSSYTGTTS